MDPYEEVRKGLAANLRVIEDCQVSPYFLDNPTPRMLCVSRFEEIDYLQTFEDDASLIVIITGVVEWNAAGDIAAQKKFDRWISPTGADSVRQAVNADPHLTSRLSEDGTLTTGHARACDYAVLRSFRGYRVGTLPNRVDALLGDWEVQVETSA